jgi:2',3'-cyclic-nucleotide 2'-phosphodiesterase (5'-nucleotidase family)
MGAADCTVVVAVGDGLASDVELARWTTGSGGYEEEPPLEYAGITLSRRDLESAQARGGIDFLASSRVPLVATNLVSTQTMRPLLAPYRLVSCTGHSIAILGLAQGPDTPQVRFEDPLPTIRARLRHVTRNTDIVIVLSNAGAQVDAGIASQLRVIDVLVSGGSTPAEEPVIMPGTETLMVSPAYEGQSIGVAWLTFNRQGKLIRHAWEAVLFFPLG